jgi:hypothetical protein
VATGGLEPPAAGHGLDLGYWLATDGQVDGDLALLSPIQLGKRMTKFTEPLPQAQPQLGGELGEGWVETHFGYGQFKRRML